MIHSLYRFRAEVYLKVKRIIPQCTASNSLGLRCGHKTVQGTDRCQFHPRSEVIPDQVASPPPDQDPNLLFEVLDPPVEIKNAQDFAKAVLESLEFRDYITESLRRRTLSASIVLRLMDYAEGWGRPPERVEHTGKDGESIISEVRQVIVHVQPDSPSIPTPTPQVESDTLELQGDELDHPMIPVPPRRMH